VRAGVRAPPGRRVRGRAAADPREGGAGRGGAALVPPAGDYVRVTFYPLENAAGDAFVAEVNQADATFRVAGKDGRGMPPGKYRVAVELDHRRSDKLKGRFGADNSPFVYEVTAATGELVLDLDAPPRG
jgi:hypothetical protein